MKGKTKPIAYHRPKDLLAPTSEDRITMALDVPQSLYDKIHDLAVERQCSLSAVIRAALVKYLV